MKDLRRNEFIDMLNMAELLYTGNDKCIVCDIPTLGAVTYYPKADKLNIHKANKWEDNGYEFVKNVLANTTKEEIDTQSTSTKSETNTENNVNPDPVDTKPVVPQDNKFMPNAVYSVGNSYTVQSKDGKKYKLVLEEI